MKPPLREPHFEITMEVRDHELDRFGVVNNAVYQNYLEHARHAFLASRGISLTHLLEEKFRPVITRIDLEYLLPLQSGDSFSVPALADEVNPGEVSVFPTDPKNPFDAVNDPGIRDWNLFGTE